MKKKAVSNQDIAAMFSRMAELHEINGVAYKPAAYRKAAKIVEGLQENLTDIYKKQSLKGLEALSGIGKSTATKIEEYIKTGKVRSLKELEEKTALREIITHFFQTKGIPLSRLKMDARKQKIVYSRYAAPAKQLLELAGSTEKAKIAIDKIAMWASSRELDYSIETVFKRWLELDKLKPKEIIKKPFYEGHPMVWVETKKKWFVVMPGDDWREFADDVKKIEWVEAPKS